MTASFTHVPRVLVLLPILVLLNLGCSGTAEETLPTSQAGDAQDQPSLRRVWADVRDYASPSPDGNLITFVDWTTGDVAVHDLRTGEDRLVTNKGSWEENGSWAEEPLFSPDGREIAYTYGNVLSGDPFRYELRVVDVRDGTDRLVLPIDVADSWILPLDWHETAGILVEIDRADDSSELGLVGSEDNQLRVVHRFAPGEDNPDGAYLSPDGHHIVYRQADALRLVGADGSGDRSLDVAGAKLLGWAPDGFGVLFHASYDGVRGIWRLPIDQGSRSGDPVAVHSGIPALRPSGLTEDGYFYIVPVEAPKVFLTAVDLEHGGLLMQPTAVTAPADGAATAPVWSPDGRSFAYSLSGLDRHSRIMVRTADGENVRQVDTPALERIFTLEWGPDGTSLYIISNGTKEPALYRLELPTGELEKLVEPSGRAFALTPDARQVVISPPGSIVVRDLETGQERQLVERQGSDNLAVSPDGQTVAYVLRDSVGSSGRILTVPIGGGPSLTLVRIPEGQHLERDDHSLQYSSDGRFIIALVGDSTNAHQLVSFPVGGGNPRVLVDFAKRIGGEPERAHASLHPDGRRLLYSTGFGRSELWMMEDLRGTQVNRD